MRRHSDFSFGMRISPDCRIGSLDEAAIISVYESLSDFLPVSNDSLVCLHVFDRLSNPVL